MRSLCSKQKGKVTKKDTKSGKFRTDLNSKKPFPWVLLYLAVSKKLFSAQQSQSSYLNTRTSLQHYSGGRKALFSSSSCDLTSGPKYGVMLVKKGHNYSFTSSNPTRANELKQHLQGSWRMRDTKTQRRSTARELLANLFAVFSFLDTAVTAVSYPILNLPKGHSTKWRGLFQA